MSEKLPLEDANHPVSTSENNSDVMTGDASSGIESVNAKQLETNQQSSTTALPVIADPPLNPTGQSVLQQDDPTSPNPASLTVIADDTDLIEKEWVNRAKHIVHQTREDPYLQNKEVNKIKAEYLKKRYNKDIKQT